MPKLASLVILYLIIKKSLTTQLYLKREGEKKVGGFILIFELER